MHLYNKGRDNAMSLTMRKCPMGALHAALSCDSSAAEGGADNAARVQIRGLHNKAKPFSPLRLWRILT